MSITEAFLVVIQVGARLISRKYRRRCVPTLSSKGGTARPNLPLQYGTPLEVEQLPDQQEFDFKDGAR